LGQLTVALITPVSRASEWIARIIADEVYCPEITSMLYVGFHVTVTLEETLLMLTLVPLWHMEEFTTMAGGLNVKVFVALLFRRKD
jgi:hypothetical protein